MTLWSEKLLFCSALQVQIWAVRISLLLDTEPAKEDQFPSIWGKCRAKISFLEKATADLSRFKNLVKSSLLIREQGSKEDQRDKWGYWSITKYFQAETSLHAGKKS